MRSCRGVVSVVGLVLLATLTACGGDGKPEFAAAVSPTPLYDVYLSGIDSEGGGGSALYGLTLNPLRTYRLTSDDRAFGATAAGEQVVVDAADNSGLGLLQPDGTVGPIPGLGRPKGYDQQLLADGRLRWSETTGPEKNALTRYFEWDPTARKKKVLDQVRSGRYVQFVSGPGDGWLKAFKTSSGGYRLSVVTAKKTWTHKLSSEPRSLSAGRSWIVDRGHGRQRRAVREVRRADADHRPTQGQGE